jgi:SAM-dependent methyltransferase
MSTIASGPDELRDSTFRNYKIEQAAAYAKGRGSYPEVLYHLIQGHHIRNNGEFDVVLDVGCGTGGATRDLASFSLNVTGTDPGQAMITQATSIGGRTVSDAQVLYEVLGAEDLHFSKTVKEQSVDLLTAAMSVWLPCGGPDLVYELTGYRLTGFASRTSGKVLRGWSSQGAQWHCGLAHHSIVVWQSSHLRSMESD